MTGRACARAVPSAARAAMEGTGVDAMLKGFLSVHRWRGGELDMGWLVVAMRHAWACQRMLPREGYAPALMAHFRHLQLGRSVK
jgi:hypothetical protein